MGEETRINQRDGKIYTWDEWCKETINDNSELLNWDKLSPIEIPEGKREEIQEKMSFIYQKPKTMGEQWSEMLKKNEMDLIWGKKPE